MLVKATQSNLWEKTLCYGLGVSAVRATKVERGQAELEVSLCF